MFATILSWLGSLLGGPFINAALEAYKAKLTTENSTTAAKEALAAKELELQVRETELQADYRKATIGRWYEPDHLMGYAVAVYFGKLLVWDKVLALGSTDALAGWASFTANLIVAFYFGKRGVENVLKIWKMR